MKLLLILIFYFSILFNPAIANGQKTQSSTTKLDSTARYMQNILYPRYIELYEIYKTKQADIVMLGNSLTNGIRWDELLGRPGIVERGIPSDITEGFLARLDYVTNMNPKLVFIMGGLNDITSWISVEQVYKNYVDIMNKLRAKGITPVIQSTTFVGINHGRNYILRNYPKLKPEQVNKERNLEVKRLNKLLRNYARRHNLIYIDVNKELSYRGYLREEMTYDGVHLNAKGYKIWGRKVDEVLVELGY